MKPEVTQWYHKFMEFDRMSGENYILGYYKQDTVFQNASVAIPKSTASMR
jgi:hypothetical protein